MGNNQTVNVSRPTAHQNDSQAVDGQEVDCVISIKNLTASRISENQLSEIDYYISGPLLTFFIVVGVLGNALCVKALLRVGRRNAAAIHTYLIALAIWDLCLVITSFFLYNLNVLLNGYVPVYGSYVRSYPIFFTLANASHTASIWCVVTMAAERYFALVYPLRHRRATFDHATRARTTLICISALAVLISAPKFFEVSLFECLDVDTGQKEPYVSSSELRRHHAYSLIYIVVGGLLFHSLTPFLILAILSIRVIIEVRRGAMINRQISVRRSKKSSNEQDSCNGKSPNKSSLVMVERSNSGKWAENRANELLPLAVIAKFFICHSMPTILDIFERLTSEEDFEGHLIGLMVDISNLLVVVNSSVNILLYAACSVYFRRRVVKIFKRIIFCSRFEEPADRDRDFRQSASFSRSIRRKNDSDCISQPLQEHFELEH